MDGLIPVLHLLRPAVGGMREHVKTLLKNMDHERYQFLIGCPRNTVIDRELIAKGIKVFDVSIGDRFSFTEDVRAVFQVNEIMRRYRVQVLHTHGARAAVVGRLAAQMCGVPVRICTVHNFVYRGQAVAWEKWAGRAAQRFLALTTDHFITVSRALEQEIKAVEGIPKSKITTVYNGIELESFNVVLDCLEKKKELGLGTSCPVVGTAGRLMPDKGMRFFLEAAVDVKKHFPDTQFLLIGDGPEMDNLKRLAFRLGLSDDVIFTGFRRDLPSILPLINVFVVPSISEGLSMVTLEAMASRRAVVAFKTGGIPEMIVHNHSGVLVPEIRADCLAENIVTVLESPSWAERLGNTAREIVENKFQSYLMVEETEKIYRRCLKEKGIELQPAYVT